MDSGCSNLEGEMTKLLVVYGTEIVLYEISNYGQIEFWVLHILTHHWMIINHRNKKFIFQDAKPTMETYSKLSIKYGKNSTPHSKELMKCPDDTQHPRN